MKKILIIFFLLFPFIVKAETCDLDKITIESITVEDRVGNAVEKSTATVENKNISLDLSMHDVGDSITYKMVVRNESSDDFELDKDSLNNNSDYIHYSFANNDDSVVVNARSMKTIYLNIEYENEVPASSFNGDDYNIEKTVTLSLTANNSIINPSTGVKSITLVILILLSISIISYLVLHNNPYLKPFIIILGLIIIPIGIHAACKCDIVINSNIEIDKIAEFDTGKTINNKMKILSNGYGNVYSFLRSDTLPDEVKEAVEEELNNVQNITVTDEEVEDILDIIKDNHYIYYSLEVEDRLVSKRYVLKQTQNTYNFDTSDITNILQGLPLDDVIILRNGDSEDYNYLMYDDSVDDLVILSENEYKTKIRNEILFFKKNEATQNIFSSKNSDYIIYGWYDDYDEVIYYYCDKNDVYLNSDPSFMFAYMNYLVEAPGIETVNTINVNKTDYMFLESGFESTVFNLDLSAWNTSNVTSLIGMFANRANEGYWSKIENLNINLSNWDTSKVTSMSKLFWGLAVATNEWSITGLENWNTSRVTDMSFVFNGLGSNNTTYELDLSAWDTSKVTNMESMFSGLKVSSIGDISLWDVSNVTNMSKLFGYINYGGYEPLVLNLSKWDVSNVVDMGYLFEYGYISSVGDISSWDISNVKYMNNMFSGMSLDSIGDISSWDVSNVIYMNRMFKNFKTQPSVEFNLSSWDVSNVINMEEMFHSSSIVKLNLSGWNTSNVVNMKKMFEWSLGSPDFEEFEWNLSNWNVTSVEDMNDMFSQVATYAKSFELNLSGWNLQSAKEINNMFSGLCENAETFNLDLSSWNTSNVENMSWMFCRAGYYSNEFTLNLSGWDTSKVTKMNNMFDRAGYSATTWNIIGLENWNVSSVNNFAYMFSETGYNAETYNLDLSAWNTSSAISMNGMFKGAGYNSASWNIGNLSGWDPTNVSYLSYMFYEAGKNATTWNSIGTLKVNAADISNIFNGCSKANATLNIYNNPTAYSNAFKNAATASTASIVVNYTDNVTSINNIVATKSSGSHVTKGSLITE